MGFKRFYDFKSACSMRLKGSCYLNYAASPTIQLYLKVVQKTKFAHL